MSIDILLWGYISNVILSPIAVGIPLNDGDIKTKKGFLVAVGLGIIPFFYLGCIIFILAAASVLCVIDAFRGLK